MRAFYSLSLVLAIVAGTNGQPAQDKSDKGIWETVFVRDSQGRDQQVGHSALFVETQIVNGKKIVRAKRELKITFKRGGDTAELKAERGTDEDENGKVIGIFSKQSLGKDQSMQMTGVVDPTGKKIALTINAAVKNNFVNPWDSKAVGILGEVTLFKDKKIKAGDSFSYCFFEPTVTSIVTVQVNVQDLENVLLPRGGKKQLLRVELKPEKIQEIQLPASTVWLDPKSLEPLLTQTEVPGIGLLSMERSTQGIAKGVIGEVPDLMSMQTIRLNQFIQGDVHQLHSIVYRITVKSKDVELDKLVKQDNRQSIKNLNDNSFELLVTAIRSPQRVDKESPAKDEFLESNYFINFKDGGVKELARKAVGNLTDPWEKAKAIESWVRNNMKVANYTEAMATSDHVAVTLTGDCSEFSMLMAAMCRAQGIPSRTALGMVYVSSGRNASLPFHMWTEVYIKGQWIGMDSTLGRGSIGPGHIKITDHSWHDVKDFKPLLPFTRFLMAKPTIEILEVHQQSDK